MVKSSGFCVVGKEWELGELLESDCSGPGEMVASAKM